MVYSCRPTGPESGSPTGPGSQKRSFGRDSRARGCRDAKDRELERTVPPRRSNTDTRRSPSWSGRCGGGQSCQTVGRTGHRLHPTCLCVDTGLPVRRESVSPKQPSPVTLVGVSCPVREHLSPEPSGHPSPSPSDPLPGTRTYLSHPTPGEDTSRPIDSLPVPFHFVKH